MNLIKRLQTLQKRTGGTIPSFHHTPDILNMIRDRYAEHEKVVYSNWSCVACTYINLASAMECDMCGGGREITTSVVVIDVDDTLEEAVVDIDAIDVRESSATKRSRVEHYDSSNLTVQTEISQVAEHVVVEPPTPAAVEYRSNAISDEELDARLK